MGSSRAAQVENPEAKEGSEADRAPLRDGAGAKGNCIWRRVEFGVASESWVFDGCADMYILIYIIHNHTYIYNHIYINIYIIVYIIILYNHIYIIIYI